MDLTGMVEELQAVINDDASHPEWTEDMLISYLAEGQDKFCEDTGYFRDISTYTIELKSGVVVYTIPDRVIQLLSIWDGAKKLTKMLTGEERDESGFIWGVGGEGRPTQWRTDRETGAILFNNTPTVADAGHKLGLYVWRYSIIDLADTGGKPEIPLRFHRACIEWAAYKAFNHHDAETQDPVKARDHYQSYQEYVTSACLALRRIHNEETWIGSNPSYRT